MTTVDVGLTFQPFVGATFTSFVGPTIFVSQQMKTVGVGGNYAPFVEALLLFLHILALKSVGGTFSLLLDQQFSVPDFVVLRSYGSKWSRFPKRLQGGAIMAPLFFQCKGTLSCFDFCFKMIKMNFYVVCGNC